MRGRRHRAQWLIYNMFMRKGSATEQIDSIAVPTPAPDISPMPPIMPVKREWRAAVLEAVAASHKMEPLAEPVRNIK